jgi:hypothetical protein
MITGGRKWRARNEKAVLIGEASKSKQAGLRQGFGVRMWDMIVGQFCGTEIAV